VEPFDLLASLTARLASTARLDEIVDAVLHEIVALGFGAVWVAVLDEQTGTLSTVKDISDGVDTTHSRPKLVALDQQQPLGHGFQERRIINIPDPDALHIIERDGEPVPPDKLGLPRKSYEHLHGHPFACGPLLGSCGQPVGALTLASYRGNQPIPDAILSRGLLRVLIDHLGIAMERAIHTARVERLRASLAEAQAATARDAQLKAVGEEAEFAAHNLNNLLEFAMLAIGGGLRSPAAAFEVLPQIERTNRAIGDLVASLQRIARASSSQIENANLPQIVDDVLTIVTPSLCQQSVEIASDIAAVPLVRCDAALIHQVVLNLVINARDALRERNGEQRQIQIRVRDDGGGVRLVVADNGPGIAPEVLAHLFQRNISTKGAHHGLGLARAHASLQRFGGRIEGRNAPSGGAEFEVTLVAAPPGTLELSTQPRVAPRARDATRRARILVADDDFDIVTVTRASLEPQYEVSTVTSSAQAIDVATVGTFDLVLCDMGMPKHSGVDVCRLLRAAGYRGKFVLMTGWESQGVSAEQRAAGCDALLKKPFGAAELIYVIQSLLDS
jgi:signal transduction histidine kinase